MKIVNAEPVIYAGKRWEPGTLNKPASVPMSESWREVEDPHPEVREKPRLTSGDKRLKKPRKR